MVNIKSEMYKGYEITFQKIKFPNGIKGTFGYVNGHELPAETKEEALKLAKEVIDKRPEMLSIDKRYYIQNNIGKAKYVINYYSGKKHTDGSDFYDMEIFHNKKKLDKFEKGLLVDGYKYK